MKLICLLSTVILTLSCSTPSGLPSDGKVLVEENFEAGLGAWSMVNPDSIEIFAEPGMPGNNVLQLTPENGKYTHAIFLPSMDWHDIRIEGRFLFPTEGNGYLGLIYNYQEKDGRKDFGCMYIKSNGNYVKVSPHHDGNPSWRLYEDLRVNLTGAQQIEVNKWYRFRLDVAGFRASLYLVDMEKAIRTFDWIPDYGAFGLEARPGGGEPVWVDDVVVTKLEPSRRDESKDSSQVRAENAGDVITSWEIQGPFDEGETEPEKMPPADLDESNWRTKETDQRGAVITALDSDFNISSRKIVYLRTTIAGSDGARQALTISTVNKLHLWLNGEFVGTVEPEYYIWSDFLTNPDHAGSSLPLQLREGPNQIVIRVDGSRFAGGGFLAALI